MGISKVEIAVNFSVLKPPRVKVEKVKNTALRSWSIHPQMTLKKVFIEA